jgi:hypothetical protein
MEKRNIEVDVVKRHIYGSIRDVGYSYDTVIDVIAWLQSVLASVPVEYRDSVKISFDNDYEYGESYEQVRIYYTRLETDEEASRRISDEHAHRAQRKAWLKSQLQDLE